MAVVRHLVQGHQLWCQSNAHMQLPIVIGHVCWFVCLFMMLVISRKVKVRFYEI